MSPTQLWVFAGPNGAGKSTVVARFRISERISVVNPDVIAQRIKPGHHNEPSVMLRAGRLAASERRALLKARQSFAFETTLTGHSEIRVMQQAREAGYKTNLVFIGVADALTALARVREREAVGGHSVPAGLVLRRYSKSLANLPAAIRLADRCFILDNTGGPAPAAYDDRRRPASECEPSPVDLGAQGYAPNRAAAGTPSILNERNRPRRLPSVTQ